MEYSVRFIAGEPRFDTLEVIKLRCEASIDINSRIFGQAQLGRGDEFFYARVWSFETRPTEKSSVSVRLEHNGRDILMRADAGGSARLLLDGGEKQGLMTSYLITGSDLQGEYWGAVMLLPSELLFSHFGLDEAALPAVIGGNILRENPALSSAAPIGGGMGFKLLPRA